MRPTKYTPELLEKAHTYLDAYVTAIPSHIGLAKYLGIGTSTLYDWGKDPDKEEFSDILGLVMQTQHEVLWDGGLRGDLNSNLVKLALNKHGYNDKQEIDHTTHGESLPVKILLSAEVTCDEDE
jgi:hypothetical protein